MRARSATGPGRCCWPPGNRPTSEQLGRCAPYLHDEIRILAPRALVCLGAIAWNATVSVLGDRGIPLPKPKPRFAHGAAVPLGSVTCLGCYHVSQQNTFTGRLTPAMLDAVLRRAKTVARA